MTGTNERIRIGVAGTGYVSRMFTHAVASVPDAELTRVLTRRPPESCLEFPRPELLTQSIEQLVADCDLVLECSGDPRHAFAVASQAVEAGRPVVTMNAEFHVTCGSAFIGRGLVTEAEGDQPGCQAALHEEVLELGFRPLVYGNMKGFLNHTPTPDEMAYWGERQGISLSMVTASTDGTKVQFEQALVANGFGATIAQQGMLGPAHDDLRTGGEELARAAERIGQPISDYLLSGALGHGVFIVATHDEIQRDALRYFKLGDGPFYVLVKPNIFVHLEILRTIRRAVREGRGLLDNSATPTVSVAAIAKRDLAPGTHIEHGIGSFEVRGEAVRIADAAGHMPIGLLADATIRRGVEAGETLRLDDVDLPWSAALDAWREIETGALAAGAHAAGAGAVPVAAATAGAAAGERSVR